MGVYIRGMKIADCCMNCPFSVSVNFGLVCCPMHTIIPDNKLFDADGNDLGRQPWCPVIEIPPHGRLIDADDFDERIRQAGGMCEEELTEDFKDGVQTVLAMLKTQTTIIPAEEGE